ncbi:hypothetical protein [Amphibacillus indicireducens]|uniref:Uncharacterized protein n=1 Tax=Amphibacillus indicireducens TaxID=1076330 RepID=A0ABP7VXA1_9BACI
MIWVTLLKDLPDHDIESIYNYPEQAGFESNFTNEDDINNARSAVDEIWVD